MLQNKFKFLVVIVITGFLAILYNDYFMGILFLAVVTLPFILFAILSYTYGRLSFELISVVHVANKGETIPVSVQINNPTVFPIASLSITISYSNSFLDQFKDNKQDFYVSVDSRTTTNVTINLKSDYAGNLIISFLRVRIFDYLKIFSLRKKNLGEIKVAVLPNYYELTEDYLKDCSKMQIESDYFSTIKSGDDPSEVFAIREYREGDRPQRIHWKLSLKQDQLMIKDFSEPLNCSVVIFADFDISRWDDALETIDSLLECTLSLSYSLMLKGQIHYLVWYDKLQGSCRRIRIVTEKDLFEAVDGLINCDPYIQDVDLTAIYFAEYPNDQYTDLFYITNAITDEKLNSLILVKAIGRQILYVNKRGYSNTQISSEMQWDIPITKEFARKVTEAGIGLFSIDSADIKADLEDIKLG